jgi:hypothetical protein
MTLPFSLPRAGRAAVCGLLAAGVVAAGAATAQAAPQPSADGVPVTAARLAVWSTSGADRAYLGQLRFGQMFEVRRYSANGRWAYGIARGGVDRRGWVRAVALQGARPPQPTPLRICAASEDVSRDATGLPVIGTLHRRDRFSVIRFSGRGREAYGVAGGDVDGRGWIDTSALCQF